jgi:hypothetical protein
MSASIAQPDHLCMHCNMHILLPLLILLHFCYCCTHCAGGTDMSNATGSPAEGQQAAGGYPVGGSPMTGGSPDGSSAAGNEPAGVGAVVATPGATTLQQAAATAAAAAAITAGGARFSSITNPSTGTGYATPLTPATAFLTAGGPAGNTTAALMASPAVQAEMMQNGNAAGRRHQGM